MYVDVRSILFFPWWPFLSHHAFLFNPPVKVVGNFKVKAYASLYNDLYLRDSHKQTAKQDMSQFFPAATKRKQGNTKDYILKTKTKQ